MLLLTVLWEREEVGAEGEGGWAGGGGGGGGRVVVVGGYGCGASRCSLIVPSDCAARDVDPPPLHADGAVSSVPAVR